MEIRTIGFTKWSAERFFGVLREHSVRRLIDTRLNNTSQLAGFAKQRDLAYFLEEIVGAEYLHEPLLVPEAEDLRAYRAGAIEWSQYEARYLNILADRDVTDRIERDLFAEPTVLLCSEHDPDHCHRRLAAEYLAAAWGGVEVVHL